MFETVATTVGCKIVNGVVQHIIGIFGGVIRREVARLLKDGNFTNELCRRLIVDDIEDIKSKLHGMAKKDLLSSLCFFEDGVNDLFKSIHQSPSGTIESLKSNERFTFAINSFELAYEKATEAFCSVALSTEDRIQASQIRMRARILARLGDLKDGVDDCFRYLEQLHSSRAIEETFSVLTAGGMQSWFDQTKQFRNASAVHTINQTLFDFARKFTKLPPSILKWPTISLDKRSYHPMFGDDRVVKKLEESSVKVMPPSLYVAFGEKVNPGCSVVNSKGEIVANIWDKSTLKVFKHSRESHELCDVPRKEDAERWRVCAMDVDEEDNIYVITASEEREIWTFHLFVFDANGNKKVSECVLPFDQKYFASAVSISINKQGKIAILDRVNKMVYTGNVCVELNAYKVEKSFHVKQVPLSIFFSSKNILFSYFNGIKIIVLGWKNIYIYTENGDLEERIMIPEKYEAGVSLEINHVMQPILNEHGVIKSLMHAYFRSWGVSQFF